MNGPWSQNIVPIRPAALPLFEAHLLRLKRDVREQRFGSFVSDEFLHNYALNSARLCMRLHACVLDGTARGAAELRLIDDSGCRAEAAFSVETAWQDRGIGTALMARIVEDVAGLGIAEVFICCDSHNRRMQRIAEKFGGSFAFDDGVCIGNIRFAWVALAGVDALVQDGSVMVMQIAAA
jgi:GNAT superfamily N-acetyltransferase